MNELIHSIKQAQAGQFANSKRNTSRQALAMQIFVTAGKYEAAVELGGEFPSDWQVPKESLRTCFKLLLAEEKLEQAVQIARAIHEDGPLIQACDACVTKKDYKNAWHAMMLVSDKSHVSEFGSLCVKRQQYSLALEAFLSADNQEQLIALGDRCSKMPKHFAIAQKAYAECKAKAKLKALADLARAEWAKDTSQEKHCQVAYECYKESKSFESLQALCAEAMQTQRVIAYNGFVLVEDMHQLAELGKMHLQSTEHHEAIEKNWHFARSCAKAAQNTELAIQCFRFGLENCYAYDRLNEFEKTEKVSEALTALATEYAENEKITEVQEIVNLLTNG